MNNYIIAAVVIIVVIAVAIGIYVYVEPKPLCMDAETSALMSQIKFPPITTDTPYTTALGLWSIFCQSINNGYKSNLTDLSLIFSDKSGILQQISFKNINGLLTPIKTFTGCTQYPNDSTILFKSGTCSISMTFPNIKNPLV